MKRKLQQWIETAQVEPEALKQINPIHLESAHRQFLEAMLDEVLHLTDALFVDAKTQAQRFREMQLANSDPKNEEQTLLRTKVRIKDPYCVSCEWQKATYIRRNKKAGNESNWFYKTDYLKRTGQFRYSNTIFNKNPDWVGFLGVDVEDHFEYIRQRMDILSQIKDLIYKYDRISTRYFNLDSAVTEQQNVRSKPVKADRFTELIQNHQSGNAIKED